MHELYSALYLLAFDLIICLLNEWVSTYLRHRLVNQIVNNFCKVEWGNAIKTSLTKIWKKERKIPSRKTEWVIKIFNVPGIVQLVSYTRAYTRNELFIIACRCATSVFYTNNVVSCFQDHDQAELTLSTWLQQRSLPYFPLYLFCRYTLLSEACKYGVTWYICIRKESSVF